MSLHTQAVDVMLGDIEVALMNSCQHHVCVLDAQQMPLICRM